MNAGKGRRKAAVALSGGVDSAAAAAVLLKDGHDVLALTMRLPSRAGGEAAVEAASGVARSLGIQLEVIDVRAEFERLVISPFIDAYLGALTPNPCVRCNRSVKFGLLLDAALDLGCDLLATGHYVRLESSRGGHRLFRGADRGKDQAYVLWTLDQETLGKLAFPLGRMSKDEAAKLVSASGVEATAPESQDICFLSGDSYGSLVAERASDQVSPGPILDPEGNILGTHRGLAHYTVGQRRGLGLGGPEAMFVLELRPGDNALVVGGRDSLASPEFQLDDISFISGTAPSEELSCLVQTRYKGPALPAILEPLGGRRGAVRYPEPGPPAAPGQSAVFYLGDELIGGGVIARGRLRRSD